MPILRTVRLFECLQQIPLFPLQLGLHAFDLLGIRTKELLDLPEARFQGGFLPIARFHLRKILHANVFLDALMIRGAGVLLGAVAALMIYEMAGRRMKQCLLDASAFLE